MKALVPGHLWPAAEIGLHSPGDSVANAYYPLSPNTLTLTLTLTLKYVVVMLIPTLGKGMTSPGFAVSAAHAAYSQMSAAAKPLYVRVLHPSTRDQLKGLLAAQDASGPTAATVLGRRPRREAAADEGSSAELADLKAKVAVAKALA